MNPGTQTELIDRVLALLEAKSTHMLEQDDALPVAPYLSPERLDAEREVLFRRYPLPVAHVSQLPAPHDFITHDDSGAPLLVTRDGRGELGAYLNVCRHRGTRVVAEASGRKKGFVCPYHGWAYDERGLLMHVPHAAGFPSVRCGETGLVRLPLEERHGFVWVTPDPGSTRTARELLAPIDQDLEALGLAGHALYRPETYKRELNWKLAIDIFLEAYHLKYAHRDSIYPVFFDNTGLCDAFAPHIRCVFPKRSITALREQPRDTWALRAHANVLYYIFPNTLWLLEPDHVSMVSVFPDGPARCTLRTGTLVPRLPENEREARYWDKNIAILMNAIFEDIAMGESIQRGLSSGANERVTLGRFEQGLGYFHRALEQALVPKTRASGSSEPAVR